MRIARAVATGLVMLAVPLATAGTHLALRKTDRMLSERCPRVLAYELPAKGREELLEKLRSWFAPPWEFVDLNSLSTKEKEDRLGEGFVYVTTFAKGGATLADMLKKVGIVVSDGEHVVIRGTTVRARRLRLLFVGDNPYGPKPCIVMAARSNAGMSGLPGLRWNDASGFVMDGPVDVDRLNYDDDFQEEPRAIPLDEALADTRTFFRKIAEIHPDPLQNLDPEAWVRMKRKTFGDVARLTGAKDNGMVRIGDLGAILQRAAASIGDGHTMVYSFEGSTLLSAGTAYPPFVEQFDNGRWIVGAAAGDNDDLAGATIESVDGRPYLEFLKPVLAMISGETLPFKAGWLTGWSRPAWWAMSHLLDGEKSLECRFRLPDGRMVQRTLPVLGFRRYEELVAQVPPDQGPRAQEGYRFLNRGAICLFTFPAFNYNAEEVARIGRMFYELKKRGTKVLIMDIRGNGGGNSAIGDEIISYLTDRPYSMYSKVMRKISPDVIAQREAFLSPEEIAAYRELMGLTTTEDVPPEKPQPRTDRFTGRFILLTDNGSFSSASDFAAVVKAYHLGTIIGTETGGAATTFGDVIYETLPYSGLSVSISYTKFWGPKSEPGDMTHGIIPDLIATGSVLEQYRGAKDPVLALALHEAREGRQHPAQLHPSQD